MSNHYRSIHNQTNETGEKFGKLLVIKILRNTKPTKVICVCDCGNVCISKKADVTSLHTQSCGCLQADTASKANTKDFSGFVSDTGVSLNTKAYKNKSGVWMWNCTCPLCKSSFVALPAKVLSNHTSSCGCKIKSSKERLIKSTLDRIGVGYVCEKRFNDCKDKYTLPFDFAIYKDGKISMLIEYDGEQHYKPIDFWGGIKEHSNVIRRDGIKTTYCLENNIPLLRIPYYLSDQEIKTTITNTIYPERLPNEI